VSQKCTRIRQLAHCIGGRPQTFSRRDNVDILLIFAGSWRCNASRRSQNVLSFLHHKENALCNGNSNKSVDSNSQVYCDKLKNRLFAYFQSRALLFEKALPWSLTKPQIITLFYRARLASVTSKQELHISVISSKAANVYTGTHPEIRTKPLQLKRIPTSMRRRSQFWKVTCFTLRKKKPE